MPLASARPHATSAQLSPLHSPPPSPVVLAGWTGKGSGIAGSAIGNDGNLLMVSCSVFGNVAYYGGGIFNRGELELHGCSLYDNAAANSGGALYSYPGTWLSIYWSSIYSNTALYGGGLTLTHLV